jgi:dipeptidyl aminopeptidase/acylaminoacyl peptidase
MPRLPIVIVVAIALLLPGGASPSQVPTGVIEAADSNREAVTTDVIYGHKAGMALTFDVYRPKEANGAAVISILSGGWRSSWETLRQFLEMPDGSVRLLTEEEIRERGGILPSHSYLTLLDRGFTVFAVRHGSSPAFAMPDIVADLRRAVRFIRLNASRYAVEPERIGLWGGSAGGHLSLLLGTTAEITNPDPTDEFERGSGKVAAMVAYAPPTDLVRMSAETWKQDGVQKYPVMRMDTEALKLFSPLRHVSADDAPTLIVHGDKDTVVPIIEGMSMYEALRRAGVATQFVTIQGAAHGFFGEDARRANDPMVRWFEQHLLKK